MVQELEASQHAFHSYLVVLLRRIQIYIIYHIHIDSLDHDDSSVMLHNDPTSTNGLDPSKALEQLRSKVDVPELQWRRRGRNKTADRLSHEARQQRSTDPSVRIASSERWLLFSWQETIKRMRQKLVFIQFANNISLLIYI